MSSRPDSQSGFTLVEVLVAITVLAVGLVMVVQAMGRTQQALRVSENLAIASQITDEQLTLVELTARERGSAGYGADGRETFPGREYEWQSRVKPFRHSTIKDETKLEMVMSFVQWKESGIQKDMSGSSLVFNRTRKT